jgi:hypothetical protein
VAPSNPWACALLPPPPDNLAAVPGEVEVENGGSGGGGGNGGMSRTTICAIVGLVCGGVVLLAVLALLAHRRGRNDKECMSPVGNGPALSMRCFDEDAAGGNNVDLMSSMVSRAVVESPRTKGTSKYHTFDLNWQPLN